MRRRNLSLAAAAGALLLALGVPSGATAYWQTTATKQFTISPAVAMLQFMPAPSYTVLMGSGGTAYASVDVTNTGGVPLTSAQLTAVQTPIGPYLGIDVAYQLTNAGFDCAWLPVWGLMPLVTGVLAPGESARLCIRYQWVGATSSDNSSYVIVSLNAGATAVNGSYVSAAPFTLIGMIQGASDPSYGRAALPGSAEELEGGSGEGSSEGLSECGLEQGSETDCG